MSLRTRLSEACRSKVDSGTPGAGLVAGSTAMAVGSGSAGAAGAGASSGSGTGVGEGAVAGFGSLEGGSCWPGAKVNEEVHGARGREPERS